MTLSYFSSLNFCALLLMTTALNAQTPLFKDQSELSFKLEAPFERLLQEKEMLFKPEYASSYDGKLILSDGHVITVSIKVRGKTSLRQCRFPKLEVKLTKKEETKGTPFANIQKFKLGTHCEKAGLGFQRLGDERAIKREHYAYRIFELLSPYAYQTRLARITYEDSETGNAEIHSAFILEAHSELRKRLGLKQKFGDLEAIFDEGLPSDLDKLKDPKKIDLNQVVLVYLFQILVGNSDFQLLNYKYGIRLEDGFMNYNPLWNHTGLKFSDEWVSVVPKDFDIARSVLGETNGKMKADVLSILTVMPINQDECNFDYNQALLTSIRIFSEKKSMLLQDLLRVKMDQEGERVFSTRLESFYSSIGQLKGCR